MNDDSLASAAVVGFRAQFGAVPRLFSAPGRVNLIGEHTDYNDGFVLPIAIDARTFVAAAPRKDRFVRVYSREMEARFELDLDAPAGPKRGSWHDYVEGVLRTLDRRQIPLVGADLWLGSSIPAGAGLSSSAALEVALGFAMLRLSSSATIDRKQLALAAQSAEHEFVGTLCGIMDQYMAALAQSGHALLLDCRSLTAEAVPLELGTAKLVLCDTTIRHELASSEYNQRRAECGEGVALLAKLEPQVRALRDVPEGLLARAEPLLNPVTFRRCRHVVREIARTLEAAAALRLGSLSQFGALMRQSHDSLRDDYEVSCPELDAAVDAAHTVPGVHGSRMTGGGFGGSTVTLVEAGAVPQLVETVTAELQRRFGITPRSFAVRPGGGACEHETPRADD